MKLLTIFFAGLLLNLNSYADNINVRTNKIPSYKLYDVCSAVGLANTSQSEDYFSSSSGKITYVIAKNTQEVKKGQTILSIDGEYAKALLNSSQQGLQKAKHDYKNAEDLFNRQLLSKQNLESIKALYTKSLSDYEMALKQYENLVFRAPFSGRIGSIKQKVGDSVAIGDFLFSIIGSSSSTTIDFNLSSAVLGKIDKSSKVWIESDQGKIFGQIISLSPYLSRQTGDFTVKVSFDKQNLIHNKYYNAYFQYNAHVGFAVPENSILNSSNGSFIYVIRDDIVHRIDVKIGSRIGGLTEIISPDIKKDDLVVTEGLNKIFVGSKVKIIE
jgi:RND family efflux transporter MFP subunit